MIYCSYRNDAVELWLLDLQSGATQPLTRTARSTPSRDSRPTASASCSPRRCTTSAFTCSPPTSRAASSRNIRRLTGEHKSDLPRYYYSPFDHEINPVWTRDGRDIIYVSNRNHIYGTGGFWRTPRDAPTALRRPARMPDAGAREFHYEETNWKARPDVSPDGSRLVYSSYLGRVWHNLWLLPAGGGDAFPIAYGDWDMTYPRWSPDGTRVAFISNKNGGTEIDLVEVPGGLVQSLPAARAPLPASDGAPAPQYHGCAGPSGFGAGQRHRCGGPLLCAGRCMDSRGRRLRSQPRPFEAHYFHAHGEVSIDVPAGATHRANRAWARAQDRAAAGGRDRRSGGRDRGEPGRGHLDGPGGRALGERGRPCAHELWRHLPQYPGASRDPGARRKSWVGALADRQQGAALSRHRLQRAAAGSGVAAERPHRARPGISHQLLGALGIARHRRRHHPARATRAIPTPPHRACIP